MAEREANPASKSNTEPVAERRRIPAGSPMLRLAVPEIPGYKLYWFTGKNVPKAIQGWYHHVKADEVELNQVTLGSDTAQSANTDMGSIVSISAGGFDDNGQAERLYLMKIKKEYWLEDQQAQVGPGSRLDTIRRGVLAGQVGMEARSVEDRAKVYLGKETNIPDMFKPKHKEQ